MTNFRVHTRFNLDGWTLPNTVRVYRQFGPWLVHRVIFTERRRGRRNWVVTYTRERRRLPIYLTQGQAIKLARQCWRKDLDPLEDEHKATILGLIRRIASKGGAQ